jgi:hypothetical protein
MGHLSAVQSSPRLVGMVLTEFFSSSRRFFSGPCVSVQSRKAEKCRYARRFCEVSSEWHLAGISRRLRESANNIFRCLHDKAA